MSSSLGFVVLARRPGQPPEPVSAVFPAYPNGLEQAQNALEGCQTRKRDLKAYSQLFVDGAELDQVTYCIGEISERTP